MAKFKKPYEELTFTDDFMFCKVMTHNPQLCKELLELILDIRIRKIEISDAQKVIDIDYDAKSVRLDVYVEDDENTVYDVDMQVRKDHIPQRMRYYQGMIDLNLINKGAKFMDLKKSFVIFICEFDLEPNGKNLPVYHFKTLCTDDPGIELADDTCKVFINAAGNRENLSREMKAFLDYLLHKKPVDEFTKLIDEEVIEAKERKEWGLEYMTLRMEIEAEREEAHAEGFAEGKTEGKAEGIQIGKTEGIQIGKQEGILVGARNQSIISAESMLTDGMSFEKIAAYSGLSLEEVRELANRKTA